MAQQNIPASNRTVESSDNELISTELLGITHITLEEQLAAFERQAGEVPATIDDDRTSGTWQDVIKDMDDLGKRIEATREDVKAPYLNATRIVDGYFKALSDTKGKPGRLQHARALISRKVLDYLHRKEAIARAAREAEARRQREAEEAALRARLEAEEAARKAEEAGRAKAAANRQREADAAAAAAQIANARAFEAEQQAAAKPADLTRTRGENSLATIAVTWDFIVDDPAALKGAKLWPYVTAAAKEQAIRAYIKANGPKTIREDEDWQPIDGCRMVRKRNLHVR